MPCGCTVEGACCAEGKRLLMQVGRAYNRLCDLDQAGSVLLVREEWWREYEKARRAYFVHIGWGLCPMCGGVCVVADCHRCRGCKRVGCASCVDNVFLNDPDFYVCEACLQEWDEMERRYGDL